MLAWAEKDKAIVCLERAYADRSYFMTFVNVDPELDRLRSSWRFQHLLRRMNFPS